MFWDSVINGMKVFFHWQTYVIAMVYLIISFFPIIVIMLTGNKSDNLVTKGGCIGMLIQPLFQALAVFISVCVLFPFMIGIQDAKAEWYLPWYLIVNAPGQIYTIFRKIERIYYVFNGGCCFGIIIKPGT